MNDDFDYYKFQRHRPQPIRITVRAPLTRILLVIIGAVFIAQYAAAISGHEFQQPSQYLSAEFTGSNTLMLLGENLPFHYLQGQYWRWLTSMFLHGHLLHVALNGWAIYQLGMLYESMFGTRRFALTYFATGLLASATSSAFSHGPSVGASGAVFGILGALIISIRRSPQWRHAPGTKELVWQLGFFAAINLIFGLSTSFVDNSAHIGGFIAGLIFGFLPHKVPPPPTDVIEVQADHH